VALGQTGRVTAAPASSSLLRCAVPVHRWRGSRQERACRRRMVPACQRGGWRAGVDAGRRCGGAASGKPRGGRGAALPAALPRTGECSATSRQAQHAGSAGGGRSLLLGDSDRASDTVLKVLVTRGERRQRRAPAPQMPWCVSSPAAGRGGRRAAYSGAWLRIPPTQGPSLLFRCPALFAHL
jgi:hypothetical protein